MEPEGYPPQYEQLTNQRFRHGELDDLALKKVENSSGRELPPYPLQESGNLDGIPNNDADKQTSEPMWDGSKFVLDETQVYVFITCICDIRKKTVIYNIL